MQRPLHTTTDSVITLQATASTSTSTAVRPPSPALRAMLRSAPAVRLVLPLSRRLRSTS
eukprot:gene25494-31812_t